MRGPALVGPDLWIMRSLVGLRRKKMGMPCPRRKARERSGLERSLSRSRLPAAIGRSDADADIGRWKYTAAEPAAGGEARLDPGESRSRRHRDGHAQNARRGF